MEEKEIKTQYYGPSLYGNQLNTRKKRKILKIIKQNNNLEKIKKKLCKLFSYDQKISQLTITRNRQKQTKQLSR